MHLLDHVRNAVDVNAADGHASAGRRWQSQGEVVPIPDIVDVLDLSTCKSQLVL